MTLKYDSVRRKMKGGFKCTPKWNAVEFYVED